MDLEVSMRATRDRRLTLADRDLQRAGMLLAAMLIVASSSRVLADSASSCAPCGLRPQDQLWVVSDRSTSCGASGDVALRYWRFGGGRWDKSNLDALLAAEDPQVVTTVFVHGNRTTSGDAFSTGWSAYRTLVRRAGDRPVRFVIWSWPSEPVRGLVFDARLKAGRTNASGYHLAWFLDRLHPQAPVRLWGHSYGARIVTGAMHLLAGGSLQGYRLKERRPVARRPLNAVLLVAALDAHWLLPGRLHGQAVSQAHRVLLVNNSCDALLKRYHLLYGRRCNATAAGYTGAATAGLEVADRGKVRQIDAACQAGRQHQLAVYLSAPGVMQAMRDTLLEVPSPVTTQSTRKPAEGLASTSQDAAPRDGTAGG